MRRRGSAALMEERVMIDEAKVPRPKAKRWEGEGVVDVEDKVANARLV